MSLAVLFQTPLEANQPPDRGLFVTVLQEPQVFSSKEEITQLIEFSKKAKVRILFIQIYRANKAWFPSAIADATAYEENLKKIGEDPFALLIREAHEAGIEVHAWMNMLSLSNHEKAVILQKYGPQILTTNKKKKWRLRTYKIDNQYFLEPGDLRVREELSKIVGEVVTAYPELDGVQFDYIRYPDTKPKYGYTKMNVARFKETTGARKVEENLAWKNWKREQVTELLEQLIKTARDIRPEIQVSTTGLMPFSRAYHEGFQDWKSWLESGLIDFVTPMCYIKDMSVFDAYLSDVTKNITHPSKVNMGVGAYFFLDHPEKFKTQFGLCETSEAGTCVVFHYGSLLEKSELTEPLLRE